MASVFDVEVSEFRSPDHEIDGIFPSRWSPRAMSGEPVSGGEMARILEAARWAPSAFNEQPWRFLYAHRDTAHWRTYFELLVEGNQAWCERAGVLVVIVAKRTFTRNGNPNSVCIFDVGSAWGSLALQGTSMGLVVHGMAGFDQQRAREALAIPDDFEVCAMVAIGRPGDPDDLPEGLREMDKSPSGRKPIEEISFEGSFGG